MILARGEGFAGRWLALALIASALGCGGREDGGEDTSPSRASSDRGLEVWALSEAPLLEIGVREGEDSYQLHRVRGSVLLEAGRIVVLNGGSQELRYFDSEGQFLHSVGGRGEGPGEFESPVSLRKTADGGLQVWDQGRMLVSLFDGDGAFRDSRRLLASREEMFPGDEWVLGDNWIVSPIPPGARGPIRQAVEALPPPDSLGVLRILQVTPQGRIWTPRERPPSETPVSWDVFDLQGQQVARVTTPARFLPHEIGEAHITGLFTDDVDVNYIRVYELQKPEGSPPGPGLDVRATETLDTVQPSPRPAPPDEVMAGIRSLVKSMASLQEIHYSEHYSYTADLDALFADPRSRKPPELEVDILFAGPRGWAGQVSHPESGGRCILAYGFFVPMGWQPGAVICI